MKIIDLPQLEQYLIDVYRLKNVVRYNTRNVIKKESVAEHSFYVALFVLKICDDYKIDTVNCKMSLIKALLHDMPEIELNDITHNVKERLNLRPLLKKYEDEYFVEHYKQHELLMTKGNDKINAIVDLADAMSVYQYTLNETMLGNQSDDIKDILEESKTRVINMKKHLEDVLIKEGNQYEEL